MQDLSLIHISKFGIRGFDDYYFTVNNKLFNHKTNRFSKKVVRNCSVGFNLNGKFITLKNLRPLIMPVELMSKNNKRSQVIEFNDLIMALAS